MHLSRLSITGILCSAAIFLGPVTSRAIQESGPSKAAMDAGVPYMRALESAASFYAGRQFDRAMAKLDEADQIKPNIPDTWMMRGAIFAEKQSFDKAQAAFEKAAKLNPGDFWPQYNLASLLLMEKKYSDAAPAFQKLAVYRGHEELIQFKTVFAYVLAGQPDSAKPVLDAMKTPSDTPAYYYAQSSWAFGNKNTKDGNYWSDTAIKVFGIQKCVSYYDALATVGWLPMRNSDGSVPAPTPGSLLTTPGAGSSDPFNPTLK